MTDDLDRSEITTLIIKHNGQTYRKGPYRISATVSNAGTLNEIRFVVNKFLLEIEREIKIFETGSPR